MSLLFKLWRNRAAKRYARKLPRALRKGWGRSASYTPGQIQAAVKALRLDPRYIVFGYAAFLSEEGFAEVYAHTPPPIPRELARETLHRFVPFGSGSWGDAYPGEGGFSSIDTTSSWLGSDSGGHGGHH